MTWYFAEPMDVWMFRDRRAFAPGQAFTARSVFPPTPQTMLGAVRTRVLESDSVHWQAYGRGEVQTRVGTPNKLPDGFQLTGPFAARRTPRGIEMLIPLPQDVLSVKDADGPPTPGALLSPDQRKAWFDTAPPFEGWTPLVPSTTDESLEWMGGWLDSEALTTYAQGRLPAATVPSSALYEIESRTGNGMDHALRTVREGFLYQAQYLRIQPGVGLLFALSDPGLLATDDLLSLGGESRMAYCRQVDFAPPAPVTDGHVKVVLTTPAYFSGGWQPADGDWSPWLGEGRLVSMAIGRAQPISGWDVAHNAPKALYQYVAAGSVYYFEGATWRGIPFTETPTKALDHGAMGFGGAVTGRWEYA